MANLAQEIQNDARNPFLATANIPSSFTTALDSVRGHASFRGHPNK
jgi:hypothetical protein